MRPRRTVIASIAVEWLLVATLATVIIFAVGYAYAQQPAPTPQDHKISAYQQLLSEANDRIATLSARVQALEADAAKRKADDDARKDKPAP